MLQCVAAVPASSCSIRCSFVVVTSLRVVGLLLIACCCCMLLSTVLLDVPLHVIDIPDRLSAGVPPPLYSLTALH